MSRIALALLLSLVGITAALPADQLFKLLNLNRENDIQKEFKDEVTWKRLVKSKADGIESGETVGGQKPTKKGTCGYQGCPMGRPGMLNVHLVAHTHDDVGWLETVDQYYYRSVQYILDSVLQALEDNPERRFIYVEVAFFYRWWNEQHDSIRHYVKGFVNSGQLEFILGGWCMNDEAATHYNAIIDQHTEGFRFLKDNFGDCALPKIGWQIDPFGHSREQASLFAQFGFDGLFFGRLDFQDKELRQKTKTMEMMWWGSDSLGEQAGLFTGVNENTYSQPTGFCFDQGCNDTPMMDDNRLHDYNVAERVKTFIKVAEDQAQHFATDHIMMTFGSDFQFSNAHQNFKNIDKLMKYVNEQQSLGSKVNVFYSSPSCYLSALNKANLTWSAKSDDFFPYASRNHTFWTGYFTSRPALKGYVRETNNFLQVCKQLDVLSQLDAQFGSNIKIDVLKRAMGVAQHHDAVSGTAKQAVTYDYAERLANGVRQCQDVVNNAYGKLMAKNSTASPTQQFCPLLNVSYCPVSATSQQFTVTVYNPIGRVVTSWVKVPVAGSTGFRVTAPDMSTVSTQVVPLSAETKNLPEHKGSLALADLYFPVTLPPLGFNTYMVQWVKDVYMAQAQKSHVTTASVSTDLTVKNEYLSLVFDGNSGLLKSLTNLDKGLSAPVQQSLLYYTGFVGNNSEPDFQSSGAYIFRPDGNTPRAISSRVQNTYVQGALVQEVRQVFSGWASQVVRLYKEANYVEFEWTVGPIPFKDEIGKEVISRFTTDFDTQKTFYTDANGREVLQRVRDHRPTWKLQQTEEVSGNYFPVNSRIYIQDASKKRQLTVLTDRSQGGSSIRDGELELMIHRRLFYDDGFGVGEALNETGITGRGLVVRGKHRVYLDTVADSAKLHRDAAEKLLLAPSLSFSLSDLSPAQYGQMYKNTWSGLIGALPDNVHLLTLEQWHGTSFLLRLEHFYEKNEDPVLSKPARLSIRKLFRPFTVKSAEELTLGGNMPLTEAKRLKWNVAGYGQTHGEMKDYFEPIDVTDFQVTLTPMQIRTFQVDIV